MEDRKMALLSAIVNEHIENGGAVGSRLLVDKYHLEVSPATVRNDMMTLEDEGLLTHQFTSAGRIPTEKGWKYYLENLMKETALTEREKNVLMGAYGEQGDDSEVRLKRLAKALAEMSKEAVVVAFSPHDVYYTGISYLFSQPEFQHIDLVSRFSEIIDHLDEVVYTLFPKVTDEITPAVGKDNPFDRSCGVVMMRYETTDAQGGFMSILGPMRMDYGANVGRLRFIQEIVKPVKA